MNSIEPPLKDYYAVEVNRAERWEVYRRLQELQVPSYCTTNQPLQIQLYSPMAAIQLWSVVRQMTTPRCVLARWLDSCYQIATDVQER